VEHVNYPDNKYRLGEVFGDLYWPTLRSPTLSGFTIPNHEVFIAFLSPCKPTVRVLHIRNFNIRDYNDIWAAWRREPLLKELRDRYASEEFSV
jgi:hypothetical protein